MRAKLDATLKPETAPISNAIDSVLCDLTAGELERLAISVIREHRTRLQIAQDLFEELERLETSGCDPARLDIVLHDYRVAQLNLHSQHHLVRVVIARLGHVPMVDGKRPDLH